ncbi:MAG: cytochrome P450 [Geminicoccaceae bacterium]
MSAAPDLDTSPWRLPKDHIPVYPPKPKPAKGPLPLVALIPAMRRNILPTYAADAYRMEVFVRPFLGRTSIFLNHPDGIRRVLVDNAGNYRRTPATERILGPVIGQGLFLAEGDDWSFQRRTLAPAFAPRSLDIMAQTTVAVCDETLARMRARPTTAISLLHVAQEIALEVAGRSMFSTEMAGFRDELRGTFERYGASLALPSFWDLLLSRRFQSPQDLARKRFGRAWLGVIGKLVAAREAKGVHEPARDLYDLMATARDPETGRGFTAEELRDQFATFIIAGHETTALSLFWAFYMLALAPDIQDIVANEAQASAALTAPGRDATGQLPWAHAVVQESLRLYPPAFSIVRESIGADTLAGHDIPADTLVAIAPWVLHRHEKRWAEPDRFDPTRFLPGAPAPEKYSYLPFGVGPRVCIGKAFALIEASLVLAHILKHWRIELVRRRAIMPTAVVTTYPQPIPSFRLRPR